MVLENYIRVLIHVEKNTSLKGVKGSAYIYIYI